MNLNDTVKFRLTDAGLEIWKAAYADAHELMRRVGVTPKELTHDMEKPLWEVIEILGPHIDIGGPILICGNEVEISWISSPLAKPLKIDDDRLVQLIQGAKPKVEEVQALALWVLAYGHNEGYWPRVAKTLLDSINEGMHS